MRVVLAGGGSAGHIEPALALADALRRADPRAEIVCLGTERGLETRLIPMRGYQLAMIPAVPLPRSLTPALMAVPGKLAGAVNAAAKAIDRVQADVLVGFGGYVATPGYLAARRRHLPIVVHEANPRPGLANKLGARLTTHVFTGHPDTDLPHARYLGIPIRREIAELDRLALGDKARAHFGLRPDLPVLLVTGGSQGAQSLNRAVFGAVNWLRSSGVQVLHVVGPRNAAEVPAMTQGAPYVAVPYVDHMDLAYAAADFALCRAGALTCAELTAVGLPGAFVPLPHGNGEQRLNAEPIVAGGGGMIVDDADLSADWIREMLLPVLLDIDLVANMSEAAAALGRADADRWLAKEVIDVVREAGDEAEPDRPARRDAGAGHRGQPPSESFEPDPRRRAPGYGLGPVQRPQPPQQAQASQPAQPPQRPQPAQRPQEPRYEPGPQRPRFDPATGQPVQPVQPGPQPHFQPAPRQPRFDPAPAEQPWPQPRYEPGPEEPRYEPGPAEPRYEPGPGQPPPPRYEAYPGGSGEPWGPAEPPPPEPRRGQPRHGGQPRRGQPRHGQPRHGA